MVRRKQRCFLIWDSIKILAFAKDFIKKLGAQKRHVFSMSFNKSFALLRCRSTIGIVSITSFFTSGVSLNFDSAPRNIFDDSLWSATICLKNARSKSFPFNPFIDDIESFL